MNPRSLGIALVLVLVSMSEVTAESAPEDFSFRAVVLSGQQAPGMADGVVFNVFNGIPGLGVNFPPAMDDDGNLVFHAVLAGPGIVGTAPLTGNGLSVWKSSPGGIVLLARQGDPAPGLGAGTEFDGFATFEIIVPPLISANQPAFVATLRGADVQTGIDDFGIWGERAGQVQSRVRLRDPSPGLPVGAVFRSLGSMFSRQGTLLLHAGWESGALSGDGIWRDRDGSLELEVAAGDPAPGTEAGTIFGQAGSIEPGSTVRQWWTNRPGDAIAFHGTLRGPQVSDLDDEGIWVRGPAGLDLIAREGDVVPGDGPRTKFGSSTGIDAFGGGIGLRVNRAGAVVFEARLHGSRVPFLHSLWTNRAGSLDRLVAATEPLEGSASGDPAPGMPAGATFSMLSLVEMDDEGRIALAGQATIDLDPDQLLDGLWWDKPGSLTLVARQHGPAPEAPGFEYASLRHFLTLSPQGTLYFLAGLAPIGGHEAVTGLFCVRPGGEPVLLLRTGLLFDLSGEGGDFRRVTGILAGHANALDEIPMELTFEDGSTAIVVARPRSEVVAVEDRGPPTRRTWLGAMRPNPRYGDQAITIPFALDRREQVTLAILDARGRRWPGTWSFDIPAGTFNVGWTPPSLGTGLYFIEARSSSGRTATLRWVQLR